MTAATRCIALLVLALPACDRGAPDATSAATQPAAPTSLAEIASPAAPGVSAQPFLTSSSDGGALLTWLESSGQRESRAAALRLSRWDGTAWSEPATIVEGSDLMVNWADFPSALQLPDGRIFAQWLESGGAGSHAYDVRVAWSADGGRTWSKPVTPHTDGTATEHGFVSLMPVGDGVGAVWLDGRNFAAADPAAGPAAAEMTFRYATIGADGALEDEAVLDGRTCECCQTDATVAAAGPLAVYRDRSEGEVRDISVVRRVDGRWTEPAIVHADGWVFPGCPVNGPAVAARDARVAVAWFTAANDSPRVKLAFSSDGGATFGEAVRVDEGRAGGRVDLLMLEDGSALVAWLEGEPDAAEGGNDAARHEGQRQGGATQSDASASVRLRVITPQGSASPSIALRPASLARAGGFPRMALAGKMVLVAWTEPGATQRLHVAKIPLDTGRDVAQTDAR